MHLLLLTEFVNSISRLQFLKGRCLIASYLY